MKKIFFFSAFLLFGRVFAADEGACYPGYSTVLAMYSVISDVREVTAEDAENAGIPHEQADCSAQIARDAGFQMISICSIGGPVGGGACDPLTSEYCGAYTLAFVLPASCEGRDCEGFPTSGSQIWTYTMSSPVGVVLFEYDCPPTPTPTPVPPTGTPIPTTALPTSVSPTSVAPTPTPLVCEYFDHKGDPVSCMDCGVDWVWDYLEGYYYCPTTGEVVYAEGDCIVDHPPPSCPTSPTPTQTPATYTPSSSPSASLPPTDTPLVTTPPPSPSPSVDCGDWVFFFSGRKLGGSTGTIPICYIIYVLENCPDQFKEVEFLCGSPPPDPGDDPPSVDPTPVIPTVSPSPFPIPPTPFDGCPYVQIGEPAVYDEEGRCLWTFMDCHGRIAYLIDWCDNEPELPTPFPSTSPPPTPTDGESPVATPTGGSPTAFASPTATVRATNPGTPFGTLTPLATAAPTVLATPEFNPATAYVTQTPQAMAPAPGLPDLQGSLEGLMTKAANVARPFSVSPHPLVIKVPGGKNFINADGSQKYIIIDGSFGARAEDVPADFASMYSNARQFLTLAVLLLIVLPTIGYIRMKIGV